MQDFKKTIISTFCIIITSLIFSVSILYYANNITHNSDWLLREELAGNLDFLIVGASQSQCAMNTNIIDKELYCNSYNLSSNSMKSIEKKLLINKELERNNINTIVLELSYDTFVLPDIGYSTETNIFTILRIDSFWDRVNYFIHYVRNNSKPYVFSEWILNSLKSIYFNFLNVNIMDDNLEKTKGSNLLTSKDYSLSKTEIIENYNIDCYSTDNFINSTVTGFEELIKTCKDRNIRTIVAVMPVSDGYIWSVDNLDQFNCYAKDLCDKYDVEFYDFNLLKNRYELFSDFNCYSSDNRHMSEIGSKVFSHVFSKIIEESKEKMSVNELFFSNYEEAKSNSPYMIVYKENRAE